MKESSRRQFIKHGAAVMGSALAAPLIVPASILGRGGETAPSERITLGAIGLGNRNREVLPHFLREEDVRCLAVCDCFPDRRKRGKATVDSHYGNKDCQVYHDHEEILGRKDIDAVFIATGDRWHTPLSIFAARAGKDVYCEKPFSMTIAEGRTLVNTMKRYGTIWQCGTQRRSVENYRMVVDVVRGGKIGKLHTITTSFGGATRDNGFGAPEPVPEGFYYDRWLGQAPWAPYSKLRVKLWRNIWDTGAGQIADMGPHLFDFAQWGNDSEMTAPLEFEGEAVFHEDGIADVPYDLNVRARYANGVKLLMNCKEKVTRFEGDEGWIDLADNTGVIRVEPASILAGREVPKYKWSRLREHIRNFLGCIKSRELTVSHPELAHRAHTIAHCANLCLRLGRRLEWNPETERFVNDEDANRMLSRPMRLPWRI